MKGKTIKHKLFILGLSVMTLTVVLGGFSVYEFYTINKASNRLVDAYIPEWEIAEELEQAIRQAGYYRIRYSRSGDMEDYKLVEQNFVLANEALNELTKLSIDQNLPVLAGVLDELSVNVNGYIQNVTYFQGKYQEIESDFRELESLSSSMISLTNEIMTSSSTYPSEIDELIVTIKEDLSKYWLFESKSDFESIATIQSEQVLVNERLADVTISNADVNEKVSELISLNQQFIGLTESFLQKNSEKNDIEQAVYRTSNASLLGSVELSKAAYSGALNIGIETTEIGSSAMTFQIIVSILGVVLCGFLCWFTLRSINGSMLSILDGLKSGAIQVNDSSNQLSHSSQSLAESSTEQAANIQETTSSLEEMSAQIKQTDENSKVAERDMQEATSIVEKGVLAMEKMKEAMAEIQDSSNQTSNIIKTIDDIAFQTNLLALNAAVEAARAGEAGKGFAVVAEEVRNLAQRSAQAARNTSELIEQSQNNSQKGGMVADEVAHNLEEINAKTANVNVLISEISQAAKEQAIGIERMTTVMSEMDTAVQNNASMAEESASSAEELSSSAYELRDSVNLILSLVEGSHNESSAPTSLRKDHGPIGSLPAEKESNTLPTIDIDEEEFASF